MICGAGVCTTVNTVCNWLGDILNGRLEGRGSNRGDSCGNMLSCGTPSFSSNNIIGEVSINFTFFGSGFIRSRYVRPIILKIDSIFRVRRDFIAVKVLTTGLGIVIVIEARRRNRRRRRRRHTWRRIR
jgi:hypothetical protein